MTSIRPSGWPGAASGIACNWAGTRVLRTSRRRPTIRHAERIADSHSRRPTIGMFASAAPSPAGDAISMVGNGIGEAVEVTVGKHPYQHPYEIAPCDPQRLMERQSRQVGTVDADFPRIRYAVPPLHQSPDPCSNRADFGLIGELEHPY